MECFLDIYVCGLSEAYSYFTHPVFMLKHTIRPEVLTHFLVHVSLWIYVSTRSLLGKLILQTRRALSTPCVCASILLIVVHMISLRCVEMFINIAKNTRMWSNVVVSAPTLSQLCDGHQASIDALSTIQNNNQRNACILDV